MMKRAVQLLAGSAVLSVALFSSCADEAAAPVSRKARLTLSASTNRQPATKAGREASVNQLVFTSGSIRFSEVDFDAKRVGTENWISVSHQQLATLDFATGVITPAVTIEVEPGDYQDVDLSIEIHDEGTSPAIVIEGTFTNSRNTAVPVRFEFNSGEEFEFEAERITFTERQNVVTRIVFDPQFWFGTITASQLENATLTNGRIVVSATSNTAIFGIVAQRLDDSTEVEFD